MMYLEGGSLSAAKAALGSKRRQAKVGVLLQELMAELDGEIELSIAGLYEDMQVMDPSLVALLKV